MEGIRRRNKKFAEILLCQSVIVIKKTSNVLFKKFFGYPLPSGFTALIFAISLFSGVQLISLGILGEYISRIYLQVKNRPLYLVKKIITNKQEING